MTKTDGSKKLRVYEIAKDMKMSSEAVLDLIRGLGVEVKSHMSTVEADVIEKIHSKMDTEKEAVKADAARKRGHEAPCPRREEQQTERILERLAPRVRRQLPEPDPKAREEHNRRERRPGRSGIRDAQATRGGQADGDDRRGSRDLDAVRKAHRLNLR